MARLVALSYEAHDILQESDDEVVELSLSLIARDFSKNAIATDSARGRVEACVARAVELVAMVDTCTEDYVEVLSAKAVVEAEQAKIAEEAEVARLAEEHEVAARANEEVLRRRHEEQEARRLAAKDAAERERMLIEQENERQRQAALSEAENDAVIAETKEVEFAGEFKSLTSSDVDSLPIDKSGLPGGIVNALTRAGFKTVGQLVLYGETGSYDTIQGIAGASSAKIQERVAEILASVSDPATEE